MEKSNKLQLTRTKAAEDIPTSFKLPSDSAAIMNAWNKPICVNTRPTRVLYSILS